jgi:MYXO-CTERM domain-containing protein
VQHELTEVIDGLRGGAECAGDCCCEGWCNNAASCSNFTGLQCPGAPSTTFTGSSACGSVNGYLVQKLSHQGASTCNCPLSCDFTPGIACSNKEVVHSTCAAAGDCCSGLDCQNWSYSGQPPFTKACCKAVGSSCSSGTDCCGGLNCTGGKCLCVAAGQWCINDADCCSGLTCDTTQTKCVAAVPSASDAGSDAEGPRVDAGGAGDASHTGLPGADGGAPDAESTVAGDDAAANADSPGGDSSRSSGCGCRSARGDTGEAAFLVLAAAAIAVARRRRRTGARARRG